MIVYYNLDENNNVVPCDRDGWVDLYRTEEGQKMRRVGRDEIEDKEVSTVFLAMAHGYSGFPTCFETMVFDEKGHDIYCERYTTWDEAVAGHQKAIQWVKDGCKENELD